MPIIRTQDTGVVVEIVAGLMRGGKKGELVVDTHGDEGDRLYVRVPQKGTDRFFGFEVTPKDVVKIEGKKGFLAIQDGQVQFTTTDGRARPVPCARPPRQSWAFA